MTAAKPQHMPTNRERMIITSLSESFISRRLNGASISLTMNRVFMAVRSNHTKIRISCHQTTQKPVGNHIRPAFCILLVNYSPSAASSSPFEYCEMLSSGRLSPSFPSESSPSSPSSQRSISSASSVLTFIFTR